MRANSKLSSSEALTVAAFLRQYQILNLTDEIALHAIDLGFEYKLGMADSVVLAHSRREAATLLTLGNDFRGVFGARVL